MRHKDVIDLKSTNIILFSPNGARMLKDQLPELDWIVKAETTKDIIFPKFGQNVFVPKGSKIVVDMDTMIACFGQDHFDIGDDEYKISYEN